MSIILINLIGLEVDKKRLRLLAAIASCLLLAKLYDWLRLFEATSFYIQLIKVTVYEISAFMILLVIALCMFGIPMLLINQGRRDEESEYVSTFIGLPILDTIIN